MKSGKYLTIQSHSVAEQDKEAMELKLVAGSIESYFIPQPVYRIQSEGSAVCDQNRIKLLNVVLSDHYLHTSVLDGNTRHEANLSSSTGGEAKGTNEWQVNLFKRYNATDDEKNVLLGKPLSLFHSQGEAFVTATTNVSKVSRNACTLCNLSFPLSPLSWHVL